MSKQLTLSAALAVFSMFAFAISTTVGGFGAPDHADRVAGNTPLVELSASR